MSPGPGGHGRTGPLRSRTLQAAHQFSQRCCAFTALPCFASVMTLAKRRHPFENSTPPAKQPTRLPEGQAVHRRPRGTRPRATDRLKAKPPFETTASLAKVPGQQPSGHGNAHTPLGPLHGRATAQRTRKGWPPPNPHTHPSTGQQPSGHGKARWRSARCAVLEDHVADAITAAVESTTGPDPRAMILPTSGRTMLKM